jgi:hypothetical protein
VIFHASSNGSIACGNHSTWNQTLSDEQRIWNYQCVRLGATMPHSHAEIRCWSCELWHISESHAYIACLRLIWGYHMGRQPTYTTDEARHKARLLTQSRYDESHRYAAIYFICVNMNSFTKTSTPTQPSSLPLQA